MRVLMINVVCGIRSTGRICTDLAMTFEEQGHEVKIAYGRETVPSQFQKYAVKIGSDLDTKLHGVQARLFDVAGFGSKVATKRFLDWATSYNPDMLWLHNIHGYYINVEMLFSWIKNRPNMEVRWTMHDCWAFTGHCTHFSYAKCDQWKTECKKCCQKNEYPASFVLDNCQKNFFKKKKAFSGVKNMKIIAPSEWLASLVKQSFLSEYDVEVIHNTIDTGIFKPTSSDFREKAGLLDKKIVLGVASLWSAKKGLDDFLKLSQLLDDSFVVVLVGLTKEQIKTLPFKVIGIERTNSASELAQIYTAADVFVNLTYEDNYPTVNLEAKACGLPIITYNTGGSPESAGEDAIIVEQGNIQEIMESIYHAIMRENNDQNQ